MLIILVWWVGLAATEEVCECLATVEGQEEYCTQSYYDIALSDNSTNRQNDLERRTASCDRYQCEEVCSKPIWEEESYCEYCLANETMLQNRYNFNVTYYNE